MKVTARGAKCDACAGTGEVAAWRKNAVCYVLPSHNDFERCLINDMALLARWR